MTDGNEEKDLVPRLLRFSGKQDDWHMWSRKFLARASTKAYKNILTVVEKCPPVIEGGTTETTAEEKERISITQKYFKGNSLGYVELLSAVFDDTSFNIVDEARSSLFPDGDSALAWDDLRRDEVLDVDLLHTLALVDLARQRHRAARRLLARGARRGALRRLRLLARQGGRASQHGGEEEGLLLLGG
jgi:hypothetical protein